ncbi:MAG: bacteriohemerythrin [Candidatus Nanoarchaeia archaeon]
MGFEWKPEYSVNVIEIDNQHKTFLNILNKLYTSIANSSQDTQLTALLEELIAYTKTHFETEERYFDEFNYEFSEEHKLEHIKILDQINAFKIAHNKKQKDITVELIDFLEDWLITHLSEQDKKYVACFNSHGLY